MYSNCLFEALKAKIKNPKNVHIDYIPPKFNHGFFHFFWKEGDYVYHYTENTRKPRILFNGVFRKSQLNVWESCIVKNLMRHNCSVEYIKKFVKKHRFQIIKETDVEEFIEMDKKWG